LVALLAGAPAGWAGRAGAPFAAGSRTGFTRDGARNAQTRLGAKGRLLERQLEIVAEVRAAVQVAAPPAAAAEHLPEKVAEDVVDVPPEGKALGEVRRPGVPEAIVGRALLGIGQDGVGLRALLEALLGLPVPRVLVGMVLEGELPEGGLEVSSGGIAGHPQDLVVVSLVGHQADSTRGILSRGNHLANRDFGIAA